MRVRDLMSTRLVTLNVHADLDLAEGLMSIMRVRHLPVVEGDRLVGLVTHRDLLRASLSSLAAHDPEEEDALKIAIPVREIMHTEVRTIAPDADLREAIRIMERHKFGCLPVVEDGQLVGIITEADFLRLTRVLLDRIESLSPDALASLVGELDLGGDEDDDEDDPVAKAVREVGA